eukprot:772679-Prorocentrum_minimum.AAC.1
MVRAASLTPIPGPWEGARSFAAGVLGVVLPMMVLGAIWELPPSQMAPITCFGSTTPSTPAAKERAPSRGPGMGVSAV